MVDAHGHKQEDPHGWPGLVPHNFSPSSNREMKVTACLCCLMFGKTVEKNMALCSDNLMPEIWYLITI